jgi:hypothetical protein
MSSRSKSKPKYVCIGGEKIRLMKDDKVPDPHCKDCGKDTVKINEEYMVHDELWREAFPSEAGRLCIGCFEKRLGRRKLSEILTP